MSVKAEIKGNKLVIELPLVENPQPSKSTGNTLMVASTGGAIIVSGEHPKHKGVPVKVAINAYVPNPNKPSKTN